MNQRQRRRKARRRERAERRRPRKGQLATGATIAMGATLAATGSAQADIFTVTNLDDSGPGSLRQTIVDANRNGAGSDDIVFASGLSGTIDVGSNTSYGLYPESAMSIQGAGQITLRAANSELDYVVFTGMSATYGGNPGDPITLSGLTITGGHAAYNGFSDRGGGIYNRDASLTVSDAVVTGNTASVEGGGIYTRSGSLTVANSTVSDNTARSPDDAHTYGGAIFSLDSPVLIRNSTVSGNIAGDGGGGIYMSGDDLQPSLTVETSTIANNASSTDEAQGGGVSLCCGRNGQRLEIKSSTITGNSVGGDQGQGGGVYARINPLYDPTSQVSVQSTIVANNLATLGNDLFLLNGGQVGFSLIEDASATTGGPPLTVTGPNLTGQDPQLGPLANNGGPTQTQAPSAISPVIDKGAALGLTTDQRGVLRPIDFPRVPNAGGNGADIGAFELQPDNRIKLGKLKRNPARGTANQIVKVPIPSAGTLTISGKGLKTKTRRVVGKVKVRLPVIPKGAKRRHENLTGRAGVRARVTYRPTGNAPMTLKKRLKLRRS